MGRRGNRADRMFWESALMNNRTYLQYYNRLMELAVSMFEWHNLPSTVDVRFLELTLFSKGYALFFNDDVLGHLALTTTIGGRLNVYNIPIDRRAYASNGYNNSFTNENSVLIYNNYLHTNSMLDVEVFSKRLYDFDRAVDVNVNAQKTPILITCEDSQRLTMENLYKQYQGNEPAIFGTDKLDTNGVKVLTTGAPFVADRIYDLKMKIWREALTYLGISSVDDTKRERMITSEVETGNGDTIASRYSRLKSRNEACDAINEMFGLDLYVTYNEEVINQIQKQYEKEEQNNE